MRMRFIAVLTVAGVLLPACNFSPNVKIEPKVEIVQPDQPTNDNDLPLSCSAVLPASYNGLIPANQSAPIEVRAVGGVAPFKILGMPGTFTSATTVSRSYGNNTSSNRIVQDTVAVIDSQGLTAQCQFTVTVQPTSNPQPVACEIEATPASPIVGQDVLLIATGKFGTAPYSYHSLSLGTSGSLVTQPSELSSTQIAATAKYSSAGLKTVSIQVRDAQNNLVSCSKSVTVRNAVSISAVASPAASVNVGSSILITATSHNFLSIPQYTFSGAGVTISPTSSNAAVLVTSSSAISNAVISISAVSSEGETASTTTQVSFTQSSTSCTVSHAAGPYTIGSPVTFNVTSASGEAVEITEFLPGTNGSIYSSTSSTRTVTYSSAGVKSVQAKARTLSGKLCNAGSYLSDAVSIDSSMTCNAFSSPSTTYGAYLDYYGQGETFLLSSSVSGASSLPYLDSIKIKQNGVVKGTLYNSNSTLSTYMYINKSGTYVLELTVKDQLGRSTTCSTTQVVLPYY